MSTATMQSVKWSLTGCMARGFWLWVTKERIPPLKARDVKTVLKYSPEFRPAETFESFLDVNGIEIID